MPPTDLTELALELRITADLTGLPADQVRAATGIRSDTHPFP